MPTYEYACSACAHEWEHEQSIKDDPLKKCPKCSRSTARRQISRGAGFILKGGGWYSDLYSSSSNKSGEGASDAKPSTDAKPAAKTEAKTEAAPAKTESSSSDKKASSSSTAAA